MSCAIERLSLAFNFLCDYYIVYLTVRINYKTIDHNYVAERYSTNFPNILCHNELEIEGALHAMVPSFRQEDIFF